MSRFSSRLGGVTRFHPDLRAGGRWLPKAAIGRRSAALTQALVRRIPDQAGFTEHRVSATASVLVHRPEGLGDRAPALLWIHGGGLVIGSPLQDAATLRRVADLTGAVVALVRYRLAPANPYPAALDDCSAALEWLANQPGVDPARVAVGGASAGGGLAAATVLAARESGGPPVCLQLLVYPMLDDRTAARPDPDAAYRRVWSNKSNRFGWTSYLGRPPGSADVDQLAAPGRCTDFAGLPPTWIGIGTLDLFHDECLAYAAGLDAAGVPTETTVIPGAYHGFDAVQSRSGVAKGFLDAQVTALRTAFGTNGS
ncbi:MAG: lipW [Marmoricola sp.]|nr:lipW [Marmoricola sp.]